MDQIQLYINDLYLDLENPRIVEATSQAEALEALVRLNPRHFQTIMKSILDNGLDPGDSLYVIEEDDDEFTVLDGNRRFAAISILANPDLLDGTNLDDNLKKRLHALAKGFDRASIEPIRCISFGDRKTANIWIERRHTGQKDGEGRIEWGPLEIQRFEGDRTVLDIIDFVGRNAGYDPSRWESVRTAVEKNSSTLERFLDAKAGKDTLGLSVKTKDGEKRPYFARKPEVAVRVLKALFDDIADGQVNSRSHNKAADIKDYFEALPTTIKPKSSDKVPPQSFSDTNLRKPEAKPASQATSNNQKSTRARSPRRSLAPKKYPFSQPPTTKGQALFKEAGKVNLVDTPMAAAFVLRAVLEHTIDHYMTQNGIPFKRTIKSRVVDLDLSTRFEDVRQHLLKNNRALASDLRGVTSALTTKSDPVSIQSLNDYIHSSYRVPAADTLRTAWDNAEPFFRAIYGEAT
ncbi:MAG: hypothetical protein VR74_10180 [Hyphomonas sp. BRH_c22]|uniref:hypothetical protein n=1 Tax=Hyphomonas sp. BRH_c22 TaxID=1629710 RepID=UPI0005F25CE0|nr:hypothetical protein [Hyphomonas sp. BRH_c22]KJS37094.1 MAG: hypothetical protein VR74_10180 [Hyphomonas sp. BRH_c22]